MFSVCPACDAPPKSKTGEILGFVCGTLVSTLDGSQIVEGKLCREKQKAKLKTILTRIEKRA